MGFTAPTAIFPLTFQNPALQGLEVWMARPPITVIGDMMMFGKLTPDNMTDEDVARLVRVFDAFSKSLQRWNVEIDVLNENGIPTGEKEAVPATKEGVESLDGNFLLLIILGWIETVTGLSFDTNKIQAIPMQLNDE